MLLTVCESAFTVSFCADGTPHRSNLKEEVFLSAHGSGATAHHVGKAQKRGPERSQDSSLSGEQSRAEQSCNSKFCPLVTDFLQLAPLPGGSTKQRHLLEIMCSNTRACEGHFIFKPWCYLCLSVWTLSFSICRQSHLYFKTQEINSRFFHVYFYQTSHQRFERFVKSSEEIHQSISTPGI